MNVLISGTGKGAIGQAIAKVLSERGDNVEFRDRQTAYFKVDVAICVAGQMFVNPSSEQVDETIEANYLTPRWFIESMINHMSKNFTYGLIIVIGSIAAKYGNSGAEDYAAQKAALMKYVELRGRTVRDAGIRLVILNIGGVATKFWQDIEAPGIKPDMAKALTADEVAQTVKAIVDLPERVCIRDATVVSRDYQ